MAEEPLIAHPNKGIIATEVNKTYIATVISATYLKRYLILRRGPIENNFLDFYECFYALFILTSPYSKIIRTDNDKELNRKIEAWLATNKTQMTPKNAENGIDLFQEWQKLLAKRMVISW